MPDNINIQDDSTTNTFVKSPEEIKQNQLNFIKQIHFAKLSKTIVQDLINNRKESVLFKKYTKEQVINFLANPQTCEKQIREMSIFLYSNSSQYRRICNYFSKLATLNYTITPYNLNMNKYNQNSFLLNYYKVVNLAEKFNFKNQLPKLFNICFYQDIYCGLYFETADSFDIVQINNDFCKISSKEDGCLVFSLDFNYFNNRKYLLDSYGETIKNMYYSYTGYQEIIDGKKGKKVKGDASLRWQEPPNQICLKINDDQLLFSSPPFAGIFPDILNLDEYKILKKTGEVLDKYKLIALQIPVGENGEFKLDGEVCDKYYNQICDNVSEQIGVALTPMKIEAINFKNTTTADNNAVQQAESELFTSAGSNINLFGGDSNSSASINLSIRNDESITFALMRQVENWFNKYIKKLNLPYDFKIKFLDQSIYTEDEVSNRYAKAATYGVAGSRSLYAASLGLSPSDIISMQTLEDNLGFVDKWLPMKSSSTLSGDSQNGRPTNESQGKPLTETGEQTKETDQNANR